MSLGIIRENARTNIFNIGEKLPLSSRPKKLETIDICATGDGQILLKEWIHDDPEVVWDHTKDVKALNRTHCHFYLLFYPSSQGFPLNTHTEERPIEIPRQVFTGNTHFSVEFQKGKPLWEEHLIREHNLSQGSPLTLSRNETQMISKMIVTEEGKLQFYGEGYSEKDLVFLGGREKWGFRVYNKAKQEMDVAYLDDQGKTLAEDSGEKTQLPWGFVRLFSPPQGTRSIQISLRKIE